MRFEFVYINLLLKQLNFIFKKGNLYSWIRNNGIPISKVCKEFFYSRCKYLRIRWKIILHYSNISFLREIFLLFQNKLARLVFSFIHRFIFLYNSYVKLNETTYKKLKKSPPKHYELNFERPLLMMILLFTIRCNRK